MARYLFPFIAFGGLLLPLIAHAQQYTITVSAGDSDRTNTPILVDSPYPESVRLALSDAQGNNVPVQIVGPSLFSRGQKQQLLFILGSLKHGMTANYRVQTTEVSPPTAATFIASELQNEYLQLAYGPRPVVRFMIAPPDSSTPQTQEATYKVFHHVFDPEDGAKILTKGPGGQYTHHRGLFFGFNKVSYHEGQTKCDIWHCKGAYQTYDGLADGVPLYVGPIAGRQTLKVGWHGPEKEVFAAETRELTAYALPGGTLLEFNSRVKSNVGPIQLDGDPQHAGFHFRASNEVSEKTKAETYYLRPDGKDEPGKTRNWEAKNPNPQSVNLPWNAMSFVLGGQRYTAVYVDHPQNPKEARSSERDYGRFGSYFEYQITAAKPLEVHYRVWLQRGELTLDQAAAFSRDFVTPPLAKVIAQ